MILPGQQPVQSLIAAGVGGSAGASVGEGEVTKQSLLPLPGHIPPIVAPQTLFACLHGPDVPGQHPVHCASTATDPKSSIRAVE